MENFVGAFQPLWLLEIKLVCLVLSLSLVGWCAARLTMRWRHADATEFPWLLSFPLGFAVVATVSLIVIRLLVITGIPFLPAASVAGILAGAGVIALAFFRGIVRRRDFSVARAILLAGITVIAASLTLLPMLREPQLRYFAGSGTDSTGYTRVAKAMIEGWYFQPPPSQITDDDRLYRPARPWTYLMMTIEDRPGAYGLIALFSQWLRVNVFQAYLLLAALSVTLLAAFLVYIASASPVSLPYKVVAAAVGILLLPASGLIANFYVQFLAQVLCTAIVVSVVPAIGAWALVTGLARPAIAAGAFAASVLVSYAYDTRLALLLASTLTAAVALHTWIVARRLKPAVLDALLVIAVCAAPPLLLRSSHNLFGPVPHFEDPTPLSAFIQSGGLGADTTTTELLYLAIAVAMIGGITNLDRMVRAFRRLGAQPHTVFSLVFTASLVLAVIGIAFWMAHVENPYGVKKSLFFLLPPLVILYVLYFCYLVSTFTGVLRGATVALFVLCVLTVSTLSFKRQWEYTDSIFAKRFGVITTQTTAQLEQVRNRPGSRLMLTMDVLDFLQMATIFDNSDHAIFAPFPEWRHASPLGVPEKEAEELHHRLQLSPAATRPADTFYFSDVSGSAARWQKFNLRLAAAASDIFSRTISFDVVFPSTDTPPEPLVTCGYTGDGFFVYVEYLPGNQARLKFNHWGYPTVYSSNPFQRDAKPHALSIAIDMTARSIRVELDGAAVLTAPGAMRMDHLDHTAIGENSIGGGLTLLKFTGQISNTRGL